MQIRLHQLLDKIDLREVIDGWRFDDVKDGDDLTHVIRRHEPRETISSAVTYVLVDTCI